MPLCKIDTQMKPSLGPRKEFRFCQIVLMLHRLSFQICWTQRSGDEFTLGEYIPSKTQCKELISLLRDGVDPSALPTIIVIRGGTTCTRRTLQKAILHAADQIDVATRKTDLRELDIDNIHIKKERGDLCITSISDRRQKWFKASHVHIFYIDCKRYKTEEEQLSRAMVALCGH